MPQANATEAATACNVAAIVAHALPAVVNISVVEAAGSGSSGDPSSGIKFFVGTGFIIDPSGVIVTNQHVIQGAISIEVTFQDHTQAPAHLIGAASLIDIALLKVDVHHPLPTLTFANSDHLQVGQPVIAIGNPIGVGTSVSTGSVSALHRNLRRSPFDDFIQTDAAINPGNSGGPMLDCAGKVVGMDSDLLTNGGDSGSIGLGFAMPSNQVKLVADKLLDPKAVPNWIGIHLQNLNARLGMVFDWPVVTGAIVTGVDPGSPAAEASIVPGDIITGVNDQNMSNSSAIMSAITLMSPGKTIALSVWHHARKSRHDIMDQIKLRGQAWPGWSMKRHAVVASEADIQRALDAGQGLTLRPITPADRRYYHLGNIQGVLVDWVRPGSQADVLGLRAGDVIQQVGGMPAHSVAKVKSALKFGKPNAHDLAAVLVHGKSGSRWVTFWVGSTRSPDLVTWGPMPQATALTRNAAAQK